MVHLDVQTLIVLLLLLLYRIFIIDFFYSHTISIIKQTPQEDNFLHKPRKCFKGNNHSLCTFQNSKFNFLYTSSAPTKLKLSKFCCNEINKLIASSETNPFLNCFSITPIASSSFATIAFCGYFISSFNQLLTAVKGASFIIDKVLRMVSITACCSAVIL